MAKNQRDFFKKKNEWSEIKDTLLRCYLPQYFQKLLVSGKPIFYIDCFAGKGKFDDGNDGSPLIAMQIINERLGMSRISRKNNAIVPCFIELNHAADLEQNLMLHPYQYGTPQVVDGKFEDNIRGLLKDKRGYNVFLYETFATQVNIEDAITTVYIVTDSEPGYREMISGLHAEDTYQLYRDYLDNFRINHGGR